MRFTYLAGLAMFFCIASACLRPLNAPDPSRYEEDAACEEPSTFFEDADADGFGNEASTQEACEVPDGYTQQSGDCDDTDAATRPDAGEVCDGVDNNCDGSVDEGVLRIFYEDADADGFGNASETTEACTIPDGFARNADDCDDTDAAYNPAAIEDDCTDPEDYNCDGLVGAVDNDGDGFFACEECKDSDAAIHPDAPEVCDGVDNNCDGSVDEGVTSTFYLDLDGDGYGRDDVFLEGECEAPADYAAQSGDCNDDDAAYHPGAEESDCEDPEDYNCDGVTGFADNDADGFAACAECNDANAEIHPDAEEVCNGFDDNCDELVDDADPSVSGQSTWFKDQDGDGFGDLDTTALGCEQPAGHVANAEDCDDGDEGINPDAEELCDEVDQNCNGSVDEGVTQTFWTDADDDGFGDPDAAIDACALEDGYADNDEDCDDTDVDVHPGADEFCNGLDNDCDGVPESPDPVDATDWYPDADGDGYGDADATPTAACSNPGSLVADHADCDDALGMVHPDALEAADDRVDNDCDGDIDQADSNALPCKIEVRAEAVTSTTMRAVVNGNILADSITYETLPDIAWMHVWVWSESTSQSHQVNTYPGDGVDSMAVVPRDDWSPEAESSSGTGAKRSFVDLRYACVNDESLVRIRLNPDVPVTGAGVHDVEYVGP